MQLNNQALPSNQLNAAECFLFNDVTYQVGEHLGSGLTSDVYRANLQSGKDAKPAQQHSGIAIKSVKQCYGDQFNVEVRCLEHLDHPNIIKLVGSKLPSNDDDRQLLALEYCQYELFDIVTEINGFTEDIGRYFFFQQLLPAVSYMHSQNICHRDLKLDNIFIGMDYKLKLADFTFGANIDDPVTGEPNQLTDQCGTKIYMAPEIQRGMAYNGRSADIFSLGVVAFMMVMGENPFSTIHFYKMLWKKPQKFWSFFSKQPSNEFKDLIQKMLDINPQTRITVQGIRQHPWCQMLILSDDFIKSCFNTQ